MKRLKTKSGWIRIGEHKGQWTIIADDDNANILTRGPKWLAVEKMKQLETTQGHDVSIAARTE